MNPLVPAVDPLPLPGPVWLLHVLWIVTFTIHLLLVNVVLGGTILSAVALVRGGAGRASAAWFGSVNSWAIPFAITFAIAPLLFAQLLYGRFFYSATILLAGAWLTLLGLLLTAYYLNYLVKQKLRAGGVPSLPVLIQAVLFLGVAGIQVAVNLLHQRPDTWGTVSDRPWSVLGDPAFIPRYLHFVCAAVAMSGALLAWWRVRRTSPGAMVTSDPEARFGVQAALGATALQLPVGFWLLFALPRGVLIGFMKGGAVAMMPLTLGILMGVGAIVLLALCLSPLARPRLVRHAVEVIVGASILMVVTRHQLREVYLASAKPAASATVQARWEVIGLFLLCFLGAVALTSVALMRAARDRPGPGEENT